MRIILIFIALISAPSFAKDEFFIPDTSNFKLNRVGEETGSVAYFSGDAIIAGDFVIGWKIIDDEPYQLEARFYPTEKTASILPHEEGKPIVKELYLSAPEQAAKILLTSDQVRKVLNKELVTINGTAQIKINNYASAIDCDKRWYMAKVIKVIVPITVSKTSSSEHNYGC